ncbi:MAG: aminotransferase class I/II-fold pyridoxal phosphate-dependent enzyme, partial [Kiritimatiellae bacterium]|nr:aminotransferase class I/II-fold pyridoxal phosphate-dependent enzyme [Kiritimatiellia bacterium]
MLDCLAPAPADPILGLTDAYRADPRTPKVNLGVGVFMDDTGTTPVLDAVHKAEVLLAATEKTKTYLPIAGAPAFASAATELIFGGAFAPAREGRIAAAQS